jgi:cbb3-type cytochrome oxidase cytochrome c subunit
MPATEETYRRQPTLHLVFALSSIAMLLSTVWMVMADHLRPWKQVQRDFQQVERKKLEKSKEDKLKEQKAKSEAELERINNEIQAALSSSEGQAGKLNVIEKQLAGLEAQTEGLDIQRRFKKAELDSKRSLYDGMIDREEEREARTYLRTVVEGTEKELVALSKQLEEAQAKSKAKKEEKEILLGHVDDLTKKRDELTRDADRAQRVIEQKDSLHGGSLHWYSAPMAFLRSLPGIDLMPPTKIQQISLPDLLINYNFKEVPRYDRCQTCHQGIDKLGYEKDADDKPMARVFKTHPFFNTGSTTVNPRGEQVPAGLYLDANGPHPVNSFGCTICHGGQGSGTDFTFASHSPDSLEEAEHWEKTYEWKNFHFWDFPMFPKRFIESTCLKCHVQVTDIPQATKLQAGYQRIVKFGCTGCHAIGGEGSLGPDLSDERQVGPNLSHIAAKDAKEWVLKWIKNPHAFRPDSRMPRFYGLSNNGDEKDQPKNHAEIHAIAHYLFAKSTPPADFVDPPAKTDPARGKELFFQKGCLACHQHRPYESGDIQQADRKSTNPDYKPDPALTYEPKKFPAAVRDYALADFGPNLSNISAKFSGGASGLKWLANWIQAPERYHPKSLMPNLQLSQADAADIASWILSVPGEWPVTVDVPKLESKEVTDAVNDLVKLYVTKSGSFKDASGKTVTKSLSEVNEFVEGLKIDDKLLYLGERTISRLGCFGCHNIPGFENAKPIGTALNDWGLKNPARLDYGHIAEYLTDPEHPPDENGVRDGTDEFYQEKILHETRMGFLYQKLHRPRSYDWLKNSDRYKTWDDRLRMPQFAWANDPAAIEEVMTFVLGLTNERIPAKYLAKTKTTPVRTALAEGAKVLNRFNCDGCHVLQMPKFIIPEGVKVAEAFSDFKGNVRTSYTQRGTDYIPELYPKLSYDPDKKLGPNEIEGKQGLDLEPDDGKKSIEIEGMPIGLFENELTVQVWQPVSIRGYTFNIADNVTLNQTRIKKTPAVGGNFAWLYSTHQVEQTGLPLDSFWNRLPPPLLREGNKVQTPWLASFVKDPHPIRPAAQLRMPRFHFGKSESTPGRETEQLADYFAAHDQAEFPYQSIAEQNPSYLTDRNKAHPDYLGAGWLMMANPTSPCLQCHAIGKSKPTGGAAVVNGPDLREVAGRFRSPYLEKWIANPRRMVPFTAMPQNIAPHAAVQIMVPKTFENQPIEMVRAVRDTLLNYVAAVELQLASSPAAPPPATAPGTPPKTSNNSP